MIAGKPERELSHFSTAAQSELFDTDSENDPAQIKDVGRFQAPRSPAPVRYACVRDPSEAHTRLGSFSCGCVWPAPSRLGVADVELELKTIATRTTNRDC